MHHMLTQPRMTWMQTYMAHVNQYTLAYHKPMRISKSKILIDPNLYQIYYLQQILILDLLSVLF